MQYTNNTYLGKYRFPDEMVSNEEKKKHEFGQKYASAIWSEWENEYYARSGKLQRLRNVAIGNHDVSQCKKNLTGDLLDLKFWDFDENDKVNILPVLLRNFTNSVDMEELLPVIKAIDPTAIGIKDQRKKEKLKLFYAKDFIQEMAQLNGGQSPIPLDSIPNSKEEVELEEQTAEPLKIEKAESLVLDYITRYNLFNLIQKEQLKESLITNYFIGKTGTCPVNGVTIKGVKLENFVHGKTSNDWFSDCPYFGEIKILTVAQVRNIAHENDIKISNEDLRKMARCSTVSELSEQMEIKVLSYVFRTYFEEKKVVKEVYSKKLGKKTGAIKLIDESEYKPKSENDNPKKAYDNYDVWFEGIMILDADRTIIQHRLISNMPEDKRTGRIIPPYVVMKIREKSIVEEVEPRILSIQELKFRIDHMRNNLKLPITDLDPDMIANVVLGNDKPLTPSEVLSMYFLKGIRFRKSMDEDGNPINNAPNISESDTPIPRALIQLAQEYIREIQELTFTFGATQYDQANPDPKTLGEMEMYRFSNNTSLRDYTDSLYQWTIFCYQSISSRVNDAIQYKHIYKQYADALGTDDMEVIKEFRNNRGNHYFGIYADLIMSAEERAKLSNRLQYYVTQGVLDPLEEMEISNVKNPTQALSMLRLRLIAKEKKMQQAKEQDTQSQINVNAQSAIVAQEEKRKTMQLEFQLKAQADAIEFERKAFLLQKEGEIKIAEENIRGNAKITSQQWSSQYAADLAKFKKEADAQLRKDIQKESQDFSANMARYRKGQIDDPQNQTPSPEIDLSILSQNTNQQPILNQ